MDVIILGRKLGTAEEWDSLDANILVFHTFTPSEGVALESSAYISIDLVKGIIESYGDEEVEWTKDAVEVLKDLPPYAEN